MIEAATMPLPPMVEVPDDETLGQNLSANIRALKERFGMTYQEIADRSGVPMTSINRIVKDSPRHGPSAYTLHRIASALGATAEQLLESPNL